MADITNTVEILVGPPRSMSWIASEGKLSYTFTTDSYTMGQIFVYVGGVPQLPYTNFFEDSPTSFSLLCNANEIPAGIEVIAIYK